MKLIANKKNISVSMYHAVYRIIQGLGRVAYFFIYIFSLPMRFLQLFFYLLGAKQHNGFNMSIFSATFNWSQSDDGTVMASVGTKSE